MLYRINWEQNNFSQQLGLVSIIPTKEWKSSGDVSGSGSLTYELGVFFLGGYAALEVLGYPEEVAVLGTGNTDREGNNDYYLQNSQNRLVSSIWDC